MNEYFTWLAAGWLLGAGSVFLLRRRGRKPAPQVWPPPLPALGMRRVYFDMPSQIAECGGPCELGGPQACNCGALWRDVPIESIQSSQVP